MPAFCQTHTIILQRVCENLLGFFSRIRPESCQDLARTLPGYYQTSAKICLAFCQNSGRNWHDFVRVSSESGKKGEDENDEDSEKASERKRASERESENQR